MALVKSLVDGLNYEEWLNEAVPSYSDQHITAVHSYHNLVVIQKGVNAEGSRRDMIAGQQRPAS